MYKLMFYLIIVNTNMSLSLLVGTTVARRSKFRVASLDMILYKALINVKCADQSARRLRRLVCAFVFLKPPKTGFLASRPC